MVCSFFFGHLWVQDRTRVFWPVAVLPGIITGWPFSRFKGSWCLLCSIFVSASIIARFQVPLPIFENCILPTLKDLIYWVCSCVFADGIKDSGNYKQTIVPIRHWAQLVFPQHNDLINEIRTSLYSAVHLRHGRFCSTAPRSTVFSFQASLQFQISELFKAALLAAASDLEGATLPLVAAADPRFGDYQCKFDEI